MSRIRMCHLALGAARCDRRGRQSLPGGADQVVGRGTRRVRLLDHEPGDAATTQLAPTSHPVSSALEAN